MTVQTRTNYRGTPSSPLNNKAGVSDWENVRLWVTCLPRYCDYAMLLGAIKDVGPIFACHIKGPEPPDPKRPHKQSTLTSAASITFFNSEDANLFLYRHHHISKFTVAGHITTIRRNKFDTMSQPRPNGESRVLIFTGPSNVVHYEGILALVRHWRIRVDVQFWTRRTRGVDGETAALLIAFGSYRAQAGAIVRKMDDKFPHTERKIEVAFGLDPCGQLSQSWETTTCWTESTEPSLETDLGDGLPSPTFTTSTTSTVWTDDYNYIDNVDGSYHSVPTRQIVHDIMESNGRPDEGCEGSQKARPAVHQARVDASA